MGNNIRKKLLIQIERICLRINHVLLCSLIFNTNKNMHKNHFGKFVSLKKCLQRENINCIVIIRSFFVALKI